jgi:hypothetical protein
MTVFVILLRGGRMLAWNGMPPDEGFSGGWRPFIWTPHLHDALQFFSAAAAELYARGSLKHDDWRVGAVETDRTEGAA